MNYCTFEQFQGVWLGSVASVLAHRQEDWKQTQSWLAARKDHAIILMANSTFVSESTQVSDNQLATKLAAQDRAKYHPTELVLLPSIIFCEGDRRLLTTEIVQSNLPLSMTAEEIEDISIWGHLLHLALKHKFELQDLNLRQIVERVLTRAEVRQTALSKKLEMIVKGWERGLGIHQLEAELLNEDNVSLFPDFEKRSDREKSFKIKERSLIQGLRADAFRVKQTALALSFYCFASTPQNFELGVKRAAHLTSEVAWLTTVLTATLLGAYNGVAGIPRNWRAIAKHNSIYQQEQVTAVKLFYSWLGIHSFDNSLFTYDASINAVAWANTIQSRRTLKIISQRPY